MLPKLVLTQEGSTELFVPAESMVAKEPKTFPAFFNPAARINRDISVAIERATRPRTFLDALAGVGARGVRIANEGNREVEVTLVEFNETSARIALKNVKRNRLEGRCRVVHQESNAYLNSRFGRLERFDAVDVDPFGTPAPYVQGALTAAQDEGTISVTATDTATLCGVYPVVAHRRYGAEVRRTEFPHEAAVRILLGFCARMAGITDIGIEPIAAHSTLHYIRVYFKVLRGAARSDASLKHIGYVVECGRCHERTVAPTYAQSCPLCGAKVRPNGPQWIGSLIDEAVVSEAAQYSSAQGWKDAARALKALERTNLFPPFGYSIEGITSRERISSVRLQRVVDALEGSGRSAIREPFGSSGLKTDATYKELLTAVRESARQAASR
ncbi:MAG TPA: hypothetical protein VLY65_03010 [Nitrososphaerales archaeon]|nr:hypothetical protein [Nitrososphaerales archaeon]